MAVARVREIVDQLKAGFAIEIGVAAVYARGEGVRQLEVRLRGDGGKIKRASSKLQTQLVDESWINDGGEGPHDGLIAIKAIFESGRQVEAVVQRRLVQQSSLVDEIAHEHGLFFTETVVHSHEAVVRIICSQNAAQIGFHRQSVNCLEFIDEFDVAQYGRVVKR